MTWCWEIHLSLLLYFQMSVCELNWVNQAPWYKSIKIYFYGNPATGHRPVRLPFTFHHFSVRFKPHSQSSIWHPTKRFPCNNSTFMSCLSVNHNETYGKNVRSKFGTDNCVLIGYHAANSGISLPTFRNNLSFPPSRAKNLAVVWLPCILQL